MPMVSYTSLNTVDAQAELFAKLQTKVESCELLEGMAAEGFYILTVTDGSYSTEDGDAKLAFAQYDDESNTYAILTPTYLTQKQFAVVEFFLREVEEDARIITFQQECYDEVMERKYGKGLAVHSCD